MGIIHVRIDDRLIHGQVAVIWSNALRIDRIMVANDEVANNEMRKSILRMAAPPGVRTSIIEKERAATNIKAGRYDKQRVLLILSSPNDAIDLIELGIELNEINVGNLGHREGTTQVKSSVNVTEEEIEAFKKLGDMGVKLTAKMIPDDPEDNFLDYLKEL